MNGTSLENINVSRYEKEFTDISNIINQKVRQIEQNENSVMVHKRHAFDEKGMGNKLSKRQQRSMKELNAIQSLEVWEEILDENALSPDCFDSSCSNNFEITLRNTNFSPSQSRSCKRKSRKSSMYNSNIMPMTNDSWMKSKSTDCLSDERLMIETSNDQTVTSYSEWDLADCYDNRIKDHNEIIDMYVNGNVVNYITGSDFYEYDQSSLIKCGRNSAINTKNRRSLNKRISKSAFDLEELQNFKPTIVDVVFKASYIKYSLHRAEQEGDVPQTKFWLLELEKTLSSKFQRAAAYLQEEF